MVRYEARSDDDDHRIIDTVNDRAVAWVHSVEADHIVNELNWLDDQLAEANAQIVRMESHYDDAVHEAYQNGLADRD